MYTDGKQEIGMIPESFIVHCSSFGNRLYGSLLKNKMWIIYSN